MKKICFVVQRYGLEVNGGAELQSRLFAEHLNGNEYSVEVITTKAMDYMTWEDEYESDVDLVNGVKVYRFSVDYPRNKNKFDEINARFIGGWLPIEREKEWFDKQGPVSGKLINYIVSKRNYYDVFVFFTYLYYPSVMGLPLVRDKAIFVPDAHDEPFMKMKTIRELFMMPRAFFFNTEEEMQLVHGQFHNESIPCEIGGIGIDEPMNVDAENFKKKYGLSDYIVYVGRVDDGKNCSEMFRYFLKYKERNPSNLKLVLMGKSVISIPNCEDIIPLGFVNEQDKTNGIAGAKVLILPSKNESLSMVVLEAMALNTPVIVNGACIVLKGHCIKSNGAFYYNGFYEMEGELNYIFSHDKEMKQICDNAKEYVFKKYKWSVVMDGLKRLVDMI